jgi:peptidyl-prolyl cis-trans isomerase SurA
MKYYFVLLTFLLSTTLNAKLLDKTVAIIDDSIVSLSEIKRVQQTLSARKNISGELYSKKKYSNKDLSEFLVHRVLIRKRLAEINYVINDDQVESHIKSYEKRLGISRAALHNFLSSNGITFEEYFEVVRESLEFSVFNSRVIAPLISITEQEIKNAFYKENINNKTLSFKYSLVDFTISAKKVNKKTRANLPSILKKYQISGNLPKRLKDIDTTEIEDVSEDGLSKAIKNVLKKTDEGQFSKAINLGGVIHVFYVKKKDLKESEVFLKEKNRIRNKLYFNAAKKMTTLWYEREANKHYVKYFL